MINKIMTQIQSDYEINERNCDEYAHMSVQGMNFENSCYDAKGLGNIAIMRIRDASGMMKMDTLIINPFELDAPMLSYDCITMMQTNILYLEPFDTTIHHAFDGSKLCAVSKKYESLIENNPQPERWYDFMRLDGTVFKKTQKSKELHQMIEEYYDAYLCALKSSSPCNTEQKKEKAAFYSNGLIEHGGPATDPFLKAYGKEITQDFFQKVLFGA